MSRILLLSNGHGEDLSGSFLAKYLVKKGDLVDALPIVGNGENYKKVKNIISPILVMHGEIDQIIPFSMGKKIFELANKPKYSYFTKYDNHMMEYDEKLVLALKSFLKSLN